LKAGSHTWKKLNNQYQRLRKGWDIKMF